MLDAPSLHDADLSRHLARLAREDEWERHVEEQAEARAAARWERRLRNLRPLFQRGAWRAARDYQPL